MREFVTNKPQSLIMLSEAFQAERKIIKLPGYIQIKMSRDGEKKENYIRLFCTSFVS